MQKQPKTLEKVEEILSDISFANSCLNLNWKFEVKEIEEGFLIRASFTRPDVYKDGEIGIGFGRWMYFDKDSSTSAIVKTAWLCLELIVKHELLEMVQYKRIKFFNPHKSINELCGFNKN